MAYSNADGTSWTAVSDSRFSSLVINAVAYGNSKFAASVMSLIVTSTDGTNWSGSSDTGLGTSTINAIAYGSGKFVVVATGGNMAYSSAL
jgi:hypothetical protein